MALLKSDGEPLTHTELNSTARSMPVGSSVDTFGGDGSDGASTISADTNISGDAEYNYTNLTINTTKTLTMNSGNWIIIRCSGDLTISGTGALTATGRGGAGGQGEQSGSGNDSANGTDGSWGCGGGVKDQGTGTGGGGGSWDAGTVGSNSAAGGSRTDYLMMGLTPFYGGGAGGSAYHAGNSKVGGNGGAGGGAVLIEVAGDCTIEGTIDVSGEDGEDVADGYGGSGGGAGSFVILCKGTITESTPTYTVSGGAGGSGAQAGSAGGDGNYLILNAFDGIQ